jgi:hypothetical protein
MATFDLTTASTTQSNTIAPGGTKEVLAGSDPPALKVTAQPAQGVAFRVGAAGDVFPSGQQQTVSVWLKGESAAQVVQLIFGWFPNGDWQPSFAAPYVTLTTAWAKYDVAWTPTAARTQTQGTAVDGVGLAVRNRSQGAIVFDVGPADQAPPPPPPPPPPVQTLAELATQAGKSGLLVADATGRWQPLKAPAAPDGEHVLTFDRKNGPGWRKISVKPAPDPEPPVSMPALMSRAYSNADLFSSSSFWKTPLPADAAMHPDSEAIRGNICAQFHQDPSATGAFPVAAQGMGGEPSPTGGLSGGNYRVVVIEESDGVLPVRAANRFVMAGETATAGWWVKPLHDWTMSKGIPIPDGIQGQRSSQDFERGVTIWDKPNDTIYEIGGLYRVGDPIITGAVAQFGKPYEGDPPGTFEGKTFNWTYTWLGVIKNVSQNPGVWANIITPAGVSIPSNVLGMASSGFPFIAGLITPEECKAVLLGQKTNFGHALKASVYNNGPGWVSPADRTDVGGMSHLAPPAILSGMRMKLNITDFSPYAGETLFVRAMIETMAVYGWFAADRTGLAMECPEFRDPSGYPGFVGDGKHAPYGEEFYPAFFGPPGGWTGAVWPRIPMHKSVVLAPSVSPR